jgi:hypothetical protein
MSDVYLQAIGLAAPGLLGWNASLPILTGEQEYVPTPLEKYKPTQLPPNEARRATDLVRMAFRVCENLMENTLQPMSECANVFASSGGDYPVINQICRSLCESERFVSPTLFHNSVHNSAAGYWSIATGSRLPSNSLSAFDDSFCLGLFDAINLCQSEQVPTLLVVYDIKTPYPLSEKRNISVEFGVAFLLNPRRDANSIAGFKLSSVGKNVNATSAINLFESLRLSNPAARCLPLLENLASKKSGKIIFSNQNENSFELDVNLCC